MKTPRCFIPHKFLVFVDVYLDSNRIVSSQKWRPSRTGKHLPGLHWNAHDPRSPLCFAHPHSPRFLPPFFLFFWGHENKEEDAQAWRGASMTLLLSSGVLQDLGTTHCFFAVWHSPILEGRRACQEAVNTTGTCREMSGLLVQLLWLPVFCWIHTQYSHPVFTPKYKIAFLFRVFTAKWENKSGL